MRSKGDVSVYTAVLKIPKHGGLKYRKIIGKISMYSRSRTYVKENKKILEIRITARDVTALRASANSVIRDLQVIEQVAKESER